MRNKKTAIALGTAAMLVTVACGGGATEPAPQGDSQRLSVEVTEFRFRPGTWTVQGGTEITVDLKNVGSVGHTFTVVRTGLNVTSASQLAQGDVVFNLLAGTGDQRQGVFLVPEEPGTYQVICAIPGHLEQGMEGTFTVQP
jgi:uncharacterized cupredoxin-like copper-binding protein